MNFAAVSSSACSVITSLLQPWLNWCIRQACSCWPNYTRSPAGIQCWNRSGRNARSKQTNKPWRDLTSIQNLKKTEKQVHVCINDKCTKNQLSEMIFVNLTKKGCLIFLFILSLWWNLLYHKRDQGFINTVVESAEDAEKEKEINSMKNASRNGGRSHHR